MYVGYLQNQKREDEAGEMAWFSGDKLSALFRGSFTAGQMVAGIMTYAGGSTYRGSWESGRWDCVEGAYIKKINWTPHAIYKGPFKRGSMNGRFLIEWPQGSAKVIYNGEVVDNKLNG